MSHPDLSFFLQTFVDFALSIIVSLEHDWHCSSKLYNLSREDIRQASADLTHPCPFIRTVGLLERVIKTFFFTLNFSLNSFTFTIRLLPHITTYIVNANIYNNCHISFWKQNFLCYHSKKKKILISLDSISIPHKTSYIHNLHSLRLYYKDSS